VPWDFNGLRYNAALKKLAAVRFPTVIGGARFAWHKLSRSAQTTPDLTTLVVSHKPVCGSVSLPIKDLGGVPDPSHKDMLVALVTVCVLLAIAVLSDGLTDVLYQVEC